jgi:hypothetical protein
MIVGINKERMRGGMTAETAGVDDTAELYRFNTLCRVRTLHLVSRACLDAEHGFRASVPHLEHRSAGPALASIRTSGPRQSLSGRHGLDDELRSPGAANEVPAS